MRRGPERLVAWVLSACLVLGAFSATVVGVASTRVTQEQARAAHLVAVAGRMPALASRIEALVAMMADPRADPARIPGWQLEVAVAARQLLVIGDGRGSDDPQIGLSPEEAAQLAGSLAAANPGLITRINTFCAAAVRASRPGADLAPRSLIRGDIDGEVAGPMITDLNDVAETIAAVSSAQSEQWHRLVRISLLGLCLVTAALVWIIIGPLARSPRRARRHEQAVLAEEEGAAAYLEQLLDGLDVAVLAIESDGTRVTANWAARDILDLPDGQLRVHHLQAAAGRLFTSGRADHDQATAVTRLLTTAEEGTQELALLLHPPAVQSPPADNGPAGIPTPRHSAPQAQRRLIIHSRGLHQDEGRRIGTVIVAHDVTDLHTRHQQLARQAAQLAAIDHATRAILRETDARAAVCQAAVAAAHATTVALMEPDGHGDLVCTAAHGVDALGARAPLGGQSMTVTTYLSGRTQYLLDPDRHPGVDQAALARGAELHGKRITAGAWIPVAVRGRSIGVLRVSFTTDAHDVAAQVPVLEILAAEAAVAIERQDLLHRLEAEAGTDALTGAANRRTWEARLAQAINHTNGVRHPLSVIILDLDHFKAYNDTHGHPAGDSLLRHLVNTWTARLRPSDLLARYGGEEFAVLLPKCDAADAARLADELRALVSAAQTCSAGVATRTPGETAAALIARADAALYAAKTAGRNQTITA